MTTCGDQRQTKAGQNAPVTTNIYADKPGIKKMPCSEQQCVFRQLYSTETCEMLINTIQ